MADQTNYMSLLESPIAFHRVYALIGGGAAAGVFISQLVYWHRQMKKTKGSKWDGWFYKTASDWEQETCTTRRERELAEKALIKLKVLEITKRQIPAKKHYRLDEAALNFEISKFVTSNITPNVSELNSLPDIANKDGEYDKQECHIEQTSVSDVTSSIATSDNQACNIEQSITENTQRLPETKSDTCAFKKCAGVENDSHNVKSSEVWVSEKGVNLSGKPLDIFQTLWSAYSLKESRARAIDNYLEVIVPLFSSNRDENRKTLDMLITAIHSHVASREPGKTVIYFENWIQKRRWEDERPAVITNKKTPTPADQEPIWARSGFKSLSDWQEYITLDGNNKSLDGLLNTTSLQKDQIEANKSRMRALLNSEVAA